MTDFDRWAIAALVGALMFGSMTAGAWLSETAQERAKTILVGWGGIALTVAVLVLLWLASHLAWVA